MPSIKSFELFASDLPFKKPFGHAAATRSTSSSLFLRCRLDDGTEGFGETLPREYVTGESRDAAYGMLEQRILPRLVGRHFESLAEVRAFLGTCDGRAPEDWVPADEPCCAAWCAVDLALLDAFGKSSNTSATPSGGTPSAVRYSPVISTGTTGRMLKTLIKIRLFGFKQVKLKVEAGDCAGPARLTRRVLGRGCDVRVDANMAWSVDEALKAMEGLGRLGISSFEQPLVKEDLEGAARLVRESGLGVMADESLSDRGSLVRLIELGACTAVNVRIAKCGGLVAAIARCRQALEAGLVVQVGCQVGESSLLSAAHLALLQQVEEVTYAEGCFGKHLLREDPVRPALQFGYGGRRPDALSGPGLGIEVDAIRLGQHAPRSVAIQ